MNFSASSAHSNSDERVLDVQFTDDTISMSYATAASSPCRSSGIRGCSSPQPRSTRTGGLPAAATEFIGPISTRI